MLHTNLLTKILQKNHLDPLLPIKRYTGGQINDVYQIADGYVVKVERDLDVTPHQVSLVQMGVDAGAKIPKILDFGEIDSKRYLLMERVPGEILSRVWLHLDDTAKEKIIEQICVQMKILHSIKFHKYSSQRPREFNTMVEALDWQHHLVPIDTSKLDKDTTDNVDLVQTYYQENKHVLDETGTAVFVHNDLHFENILIQDSELTGIIDFDFSRQFAPDYELWHIVDFFFKPKYYVEQQLEVEWENFNLTNELFWMKKYYPKLFSHPHLLTRLRLYFIDQMLSDLKDGATHKFNERIDAYFKGNWLETHVSETL